MIKKHIKQLSYFFIIVCHLGFLAAILFEKQNNIIVSAFVVLALLLLFVTYKQTPLKANTHNLEHILTVFYVFFGAIITYLLSVYFGLSNVLAAALVGFVVSYVPRLFKSNPLLQAMPTAVYCGAFVGMTHKSIAPDYVFITIASTVTGLLLIATKNTFHGIGGKLGTLAFGGVVLAFYLTFLFSQWI